MPPATLLVVDLGDAFTKTIAGETRRRFPSIVARRLVRSSADLRELTLGRAPELLRPVDFDADAHPRTRSYRGAPAFVELTRSRPAEPRTRFAGGIAAVYGAERQMLGEHPTLANVDALVHKALIELAHASGSENLAVRLVLVVDIGAKARGIGRWAKTAHSEFAIDVENFRHARSRRLNVRLECELVDAPICAVAALPADLVPSRRRTLVVDIGHLRSKLAIVSAEGCELQDQWLDLGLRECIRTILCEGQEQGLFEDEYAVIRALESQAGMIEIAGRRYEVRASLERAFAALEQELARAVERAVIQHFRNRGDVCHAVALIGGGARAIGPNLGERVRKLLHLNAAWVERSAGFHVAEGALCWAREQKWD